MIIIVIKSILSITIIFFSTIDNRIKVRIKKPVWYTVNQHEWALNWIEEILHAVAMGKQSQIVYGAVIASPNKKV